MLLQPFEQLYQVHLPPSLVFAVRIDHFYIKLFKLVDHLNTETAKKEGEHRVAFIKTYLAQIKREI
jgi:HD superfamily phosphodiesterase